MSAPADVLHEEPHALERDIAVRHLRAAIDALNDTPDDGRWWEAKRSMLYALGELVRLREVR